MTLASPVAGEPPASDRAAESARLAAALAGKAVPARSDRVQALAERFQLSALEADVVSALWACAGDPLLFARIAALDPVQGQVTLLSLSRLFGHDEHPRLPSEAPLRLWEMVTEHPLASAGAALTIDPAIIAWLDNRQELDRALVGHAQILAAGPELAGWPLDGLAGRLASRLRAGEASRVRLISADPASARWCAAALGLRLGLPVLALAPDSDALALRLHRQCFLDGVIPFLPAGLEARSVPPGVMPFPIQFLHGAGPLTDLPGTLDIDAVLAPPPPDDRIRLWRRFLPEAAAWSPAELEDLALCHEAEAGEIAAAAARQPASPAEAAAAIRAQARAATGPLTRCIEAGFHWNDLVLPAPVQARLSEFAFEARERVRLWTEPEAARLFPYGRGLVGLFAGPPGTGKTMAAQVIAADLGLDLLAVDLSAVVSKWVGETTQHLQQLLSSRAAQRAILFFDEADALYAKRVEDMRDAQDRFANLDTSHLMTALEAYPGVVILATNLKANIDTAFLRRIRHVIDFTRPDAGARAEIWRRVVAALFPVETARAIDADLPRVARIEASGALIKNAALSARFAAARQGRAPDVRLLAEMLSRELAKEGAAMSPRDLSAMLEGAP